MERKHAISKRRPPCLASLLIISPVSRSNDRLTAILPCTTVISNLIVIMDYKQQQSAPPTTKPRLIIHGGAGNVTPASVTPELYREFRNTLLTIVSRIG